MQRRKSLGEKRKKGKLKSKLTYGIVAVILILVVFLTYSLIPQNPSSDNQPSQPKAALIDHLSFSSPPSNETFIGQCESILEGVGFNFTYHEGEEVTVSFYKNLPTHDYRLIILRVHSAVIKDAQGNSTDLIGLFTSEVFNEATESIYRDDLNNNRLALARLNYTAAGDNKTYLGITPFFVKEKLEADFKDTVVIMMGCEGLNYTTMAHAFVHWRKAKVYISWTGPVTINHTDDATIRLLQGLLQQNQTIKAAVEGIGHDPIYAWSKLDYYPEEVGNKVLQNFISGQTPEIMAMCLICYKVCLFRSSNRFEAMK